MHTLLPGSQDGILDMAKSAIIRKANAHMARYLTTNDSMISILTK